MKKIIEYNSLTGEIDATHIVPDDAEVGVRPGYGQLTVAPETSHVSRRVEGGRLVELEPEQPAD